MNSPQSGRDQAGASRRILLLGVAAGTVAAPVLAACGGSGDTGSTGGSGGTDTSGTSGGTGAAGEVLAKTTDISVGGAVFLDSPSVVITQPAKGDFHAFSRTCTHAHCPVAKITDGKIECTCHGSLYDMTTGANVGGPAPAPLTVIDIKVKGTDIVEA